MPAVRGTTRVLAVIGCPVRHSLSPPMHNAALEVLGLDYVYVPLEIAPAALPAAVAGLRAAGVVGFNATIPHKQALVPLMDRLTPEAELTGSVNTVHFGPDGALGDSTDGPGFVAAAEAAGCAIAGRRVALLGAGGSGRAIGVALARAQAAEIVVANRTVERAEALARLLCERVRPGVARPARLSGDAVAGADLVVNTTSVGMRPEAGASPVVLPALQPGAWVIDIIYDPTPTALLQEAAARGAKTLDGLDMLVYQGAMALERWTGHRAPVGVMRDVLTAELHRRSEVS